MVDGKIRIWSTEAIYKSIPITSKSKKNVPANSQPSPKGQLCAMATHTGAVTVVRFSPCGKYLASGSDDRVVLIWEKDESRIPRQEFGSQGEANLETWVARKRLIGHENDVQDLAWAPDSSILVTVGLDSSIIIWNGTTFEKLKTFDAHQSLIKGVTFDPANKYFATASDDRTVRIIRYHHTSATDITFSIESTISKPFKDSPLSTYYRRCSWSPDGNHIAAANATNGPVTTVCIINRGTWDSEISLIGHDAPCEVVSFCPRIFSFDKPSSGTDSASSTNNLMTVLATAGQDKTLAIWNTSNPRPLLVAFNAAEKAITDIAWSPDGSKLFACSLDGTIMVAMFEEGELGWVVPMEENENQLTRYGGGKETMQIPSSTGQLILEEKAESVEDVGKVERMDAIMGSNPSTTSTGFDTKIAEKLVTNTSVMPKDSKALTLGNSADPFLKKKVNMIKPSVQKVTITKDGKKRVAPMLLSSVSTTEASRPSQIVTQNINQEQFKSVEVSEPSVELPPDGISSMVVRTKKQKTSDGHEHNSSEKKKGQIIMRNESYHMRPTALSFASDLSRVQLSIPKIRTHLKKPGIEINNNFILEIRNGSNRELEPTKVSVTNNGTVIFLDFLPKYGHLAAGQGEYFWAVATEDGTIYVYSPSGRRLIPGIVLGSPLAFLESQGQYLMAITSTGILHVWNICNNSAVHEAVPIASLLDSTLSSSDEGVVQGPSITLCGVTSKGKAVVTLSNGDGFIYNDKMKSWFRISEPWWAFGSQFWNSTHADKARSESLAKAHHEEELETSSITSDPGIIRLIESRTNEEAIIKSGGRGKYLQYMAKNRMLKEGFEDFERSMSTAHLENRVSAAIMAESSEEFLCFLKMYAVRLATEGMETRLEELCRELLGSPLKIGAIFQHYGTFSFHEELSLSPEWSQYVCGLDKHEVLKEILLEVRKYRPVHDMMVNDGPKVGVSNNMSATV